MKKHRMTTLPLALLALGALGAAALYAQEKVNSPTAIHEQAARHSKDVAKALNTLGVGETPFDFINFGVSGPVVVLQGFTINGALKSDAQSHVQKLKWVTHVVNEVEVLMEGPEARSLRRQTLATLQRLVPQAFPENHANIRIKATAKGDVTLIGVVSPADKVRLEAAIEQIKHLDFVGTVTNHIVETTS